MGEKQTMKRTNLNLTQKQHEELSSEARNIGIPLAELIRRILDDYLRKREG